MSLIPTIYNLSLGFIGSVLWIPLSILWHELGHAILLRKFEGKSCICFRNLITKSTLRFKFYNIEFYFVNEKGYGLTSLSISDFMNLSIKQIKIVSIAATIFDAILLIATTVVAFKLNIITLMVYPLMFFIISIIEFIKCTPGNDFWIFKYPEAFYNNIRNTKNESMKNDKLVTRYKYILYSRLIKFHGSSEL